MKTIKQLLWIFITAIWCPFELLFMFVTKNPSKLGVYVFENLLKNMM